MEDNPEEPGVRCLRIEESLSPAILKVLKVMGSNGRGGLELLWNGRA
jgi:hypothetical protein